WLDALDASAHAVPPEERVVAAISPRMLDLARERSAGSHPYLVPVSHTREAREALGPGKLLAPAIAAYVGTDEGRARETGRRRGGTPYLGLPNYGRNWLRRGLDGPALGAGGSGRLVDGLVAWGDPETVAAKAREHLAAGADHVALDLLHDRP